MTLIEDYGLNSPARSLLLLVLSIKDRDQKTEMDKLHIQKIIRYFEYLRKKKEIDFSNFKLGGVSYELEENRETLLEYELIDQTNHHFILTEEEGKTAAEDLKETLGIEEYKKLVYAKELLNDLPDDELLYFMYKTIPETQKHSTKFQRLEKKKETLVKSLFSKRKIDVCTAINWLGISEDEFVKMYPKKKISQDALKALVKGYQECTDEDLAIAKDFEQVESELDEECDT
jgi:translation initiation factor RLI1